MGRISEPAHDSIRESLQAEIMGWKQPAENTHESLVKAMQMMDGVEFDLRLTADEQLVVHHDHIVSVSDDLLDGRSEYVEEWNLKELEEVGFC